MDSVKFILNELIGQEQTLSTNKLFIRFSGNHMRASLFGQLWHYASLDMVQKRGGWMYKTYEEWDQEICVSRKIVSKAAKDFSDWGILTTFKKKVNGTPKIHYVFNIDKAIQCLYKYAPYYKSCINQGITPKNYGAFCDMDKKENRTGQNSHIELDKTATSNWTKQPHRTGQNSHILYNRDNIQRKHTEITYIEKNVEFEFSNSESASTSNAPYPTQDESFFDSIEPNGYNSESQNEFDFEDVEVIEETQSSKQPEFEKEKKDSAQKKENAAIAKPSKAAQLRQTAISVLKEYNSITGQGRHLVDSNIKLVTKILKSKYSTFEGEVEKKKAYTVQDILDVVTMKVFEWSHNPRMSNCIRPSTLFGFKNFQRYHTEMTEYKTDPIAAKAFKEKIKAEKKRNEKGNDKYGSQIDKSIIDGLTNAWG